MLWKNLVTEVDVGRHLKPVSISNAVKLGLLDSIATSKHYESFHLVTNDGQVFSAGKAVPVLMGLLLNIKRMGRLIEKSALLTNAIDRAYNLLADATHKSNCSVLLSGRR